MAVISLPRRLSGASVRLPDLGLAVPIIAALLLAYLTLVPLLFLVTGSFKTEPVPGEFVYSLQNYIIAYSDPAIYSMYATSFVYAGGTALFSFLIGTYLAWVVERTNTPGRHLLYAAALVPIIVPGVLSTISWIFLLDPDIGIINNIIKAVIPIGRSPLSAYSLPGMIFVEAIHTSPLAFLLMSAAFKSMDPSLEESAMMSGSGVLTTVKRITLPLLLPAAASSLLILFVRGLESFETPAILGIPAKINVFTSQIYLALRQYPPDYGTAGSLAVSLLALSAAGVIIYNRVTSRGDRYSTVTGKAFRPRTVDLGSWRFVTGGSFVVYFLLVVGLPFLVLLWVSLLPFYQTPSVEAAKRITFENYHFLVGYDKVGLAFRNSFLLGIGSAAGVMMLTAVVAWITMKTRLPGRATLDILAFLPIGIPGLVLGVSFIWQYITFPLPIYGTVWILMIAYMTRFLPYGMRANTGAMIQVHRELEEAAKMSGASWWTMFRRIVLPLLRPGLVAGFIYIMVVSVRELSSSILLVTGDSVVLSVLVFDLYESGRMGAMAGLAILFILALFLLVFITNRISGQFGIRES